MHRVLIRAGLYVAAVTAVPHGTPHNDPATPLAHTKNGTYAGVYSPSYNQDFFLGIPYAQPPVEDLRFRNPQTMASSWEGAKEATAYSPACVGYGSSQMGYEISEDCLYLNVIRPAGVSPGEKLPVVVWIHGGGFVQGSGVDLRYNMSFIVQQSQQMEQPMMAVTINYRLSAFGFLQGYDVDANDARTGGNWGIRDQRLALQWLRENICAFGGMLSSWLGSRHRLTRMTQVTPTRSPSGDRAPARDPSACKSRPTTVEMTSSSAPRLWNPETPSSTAT